MFNEQAPQRNLFFIMLSKSIVKTVIKSAFKFEILFPFFLNAFPISISHEPFLFAQSQAHLHNFLVSLLNRPPWLSLHPKALKRECSIKYFSKRT